MPVMEFSIVPYIEVDGIRTFTDSQMMSFYNRMVEDGTAGIVFFQGDIKDQYEWLAAMKSPANHLYVVLTGNDPVGLCWLNRFEGKYARLHFCTFSKFWGTGANDEAARFTLDKLTSMTDENGDQVFTMFLGYIPSMNTIAIDYLTRNGGRIAGRVPDLLWDHANQKTVEGTIIYFKRED